MTSALHRYPNVFAGRMHPLAERLGLSSMRFEDPFQRLALLIGQFEPLGQMEQHLAATWAKVAATAKVALAASLGRRWRRHCGGDQACNEKCR